MNQSRFSRVMVWIGFWLPVIGTAIGGATLCTVFGLAAAVALSADKFWYAGIFAAAGLLSFAVPTGLVWWMVFWVRKEMGLAPKRTKNGKRRNWGWNMRRRATP